MAQVVQAKCPHCKNSLRMPADWLDKPMRQALQERRDFQAKSRAALASAAIAAPAVAARTAQPALAGVEQAAPPAVAMPTSSDPFGFDPDEGSATPDIARKPRKKKGRGLLLLVLMFLFLFTLGAAGAGIVVYKALKDGMGGPILAKADKSETPSDRADGAASNDKKDRDNDMADGPKKEGPKKSLPPVRDKKKDLTKDKKDGKKTTGFSNDPFPRRALLISVNNYLMFNGVHYGSGQDSFKGGYPGSSTGVLRDRLSRPPMNFPFAPIIESWRRVASGEPAGQGPHIQLFFRNRFSRRRSRTSWTPPANRIASSFSS